MKRYKIVYSDGARKDILDIIDYIETTYNNPLDATKIATKLFRKCESLAVFPKGSPIHHIDNLIREYRFVHFKKYTIIYYVNSSRFEVIIQAIINSGRDIESMLNHDSNITKMSHSQ